MKPQILKIHRWLALVFSLPLVIVIVTGLILSFEPLVVANAIAPGSVKPDAVVAALKAHDPAGRARMVSLAPGTNRLTIRGRGGSRSIDLSTGELRPPAAPARSFFLTSRQLHERLLINAKWLVDLSTIVMLALVAFGVFMGIPRISNTIAGWHKGIAWGLLPLVILSPLTGLAVAYGVTLSPAPARIGGAPPDLVTAVRIVSKDHDLARLIWVRKFGNRVRARFLEDGEYRTYAVTRNDVVAMPRNWPRLLHEGNWYGAVPALVNALIALALMALMGTGLFAWARRSLHRRRH